MSTVTRSSTRHSSSPGTFEKRRRWPWVLAAVLMMLAGAVLLFDWNWLKGPIERRATAATGREFTIGDLDIDLALRPRLSATVRANGLRLANAEWAGTKDMVRLAALDSQIALAPLLRGQLDLLYVHLDGLDLSIERNHEGRGNWQFKEQRPAKDEGRMPLIRDLTVNNGRVRVHEPTLQTDLRLSIHSDERREGHKRAPLVAKGEGSYRGFPFELNGRVDSPLDLQDSEEPFHVDVRASAADTRVHASGASRTPLQFENFALNVELAGDDLAALYPLAGIPLPETPPYALKGRLSRAEDTWSFEDFTGKVGDSDMVGTVSLDIGGKRPRLQGDVVSKRLDLDDLAGLIGAPPSTKEGETASSEQRERARQRAASGRLLPDEPYNLDKLRVMDADVKLQAEHIDAPKLPLDRISAHVLLDDGVMKLEPLDFQAAGGTIASRITLNARQASIETTAIADVKHLELPKLFPKVEITKRGAGAISGALALTAQGNSVAHMLGSANGDIGLVMGSGRISNLLVELAGLDIAETLKYLLDKDREIPVRCAYAAFKVEDGIMNTRALAFDTTDTVIFGQGKIDLREEKLDLRLIPQPKDVSPVAARVPLRVAGTLKDPSFRPEAAPLLLRGAAATALYSLAPPAALLALIETGPGKNVDCSPSAPSSAPSSAPQPRAGES